MARTDDDTLPSGVVEPTDATVTRLPGVALSPSNEAAAGAAPNASRITRAGSYDIGPVLAEGGFGVVYRAEHAERGTPAAVKVLHADLVAHPDLVLRFEREVEAIRRIAHPSVIEVYEQGRLHDGRPFFAMELLNGTSLEQHLRLRGRLPPDEALALLDPLCGALEAAHAQAIVHRDVKPSNVFLAAGGGGPRVVLLDFGVAKLLDAEGPALTTSRHVVGSLSCMAPEQLTGRPVDTRTDIYALGVLAYAMLTGEPPFTGTTYAVLRQLHLYASPPRPSARARVPPALDDVVLRALAKSPQDRYRTASDFLAAFSAATATARAAATSAAPLAREALGVYVEVQADPGVLEEPDDRLLDDFEAVLPFARCELTLAGLSTAVEIGTSALLTVDRPRDRDRDEALRRGALGAAFALHRKLAARPGRDPRVRVRICVHVGGLVGGEGESALSGGDLLELAGWVPEGPAEGVFASLPVLDGLGIAAQPAPAARGASALLRVVDPERR